MLLNNIIPRATSKNDSQMYELPFRRPWIAPRCYTILWRNFSRNLILPIDIFVGRTIDVDKRHLGANVNPTWLDRNEDMRAARGGFLTGFWHRLLSRSTWLRRLWTDDQSKEVERESISGEPGGMWLQEQVWLRKETSCRHVTFINAPRVCQIRHGFAVQSHSIFEFISLKLKINI